MSVFDGIEIKRLDGGALDLAQLNGKATLVVNVASYCGNTPQYAGLERLYERYRDRGLEVLGVPCNQFGGQEPDSAEQIASFCSTTYGVKFPLTEKVDVKGANQHPLYQKLSQAPGENGQAGNVTWNFEKFLVGPDGEVAARFNPRTQPEAPDVVSAIERVLPA